MKVLYCIQYDQQSAVSFSSLFIHHKVGKAAALLPQAVVKYKDS